MFEEGELGSLCRIPVNNIISWKMVSMDLTRISWILDWALLALLLSLWSYDMHRHSHKLNTTILA